MNKKITLYRSYQIKKSAESEHMARRIAMARKQATQLTTVKTVKVTITKKAGKNTPSKPKPATIPKVAADPFFDDPRQE